PLKTLVVTSAEPEDGKTTTAVNLALALAEQGHRVVLVAADQRRPVLHKVLHTERAPGLSDVLRGTAVLETVIHHVPLPDHATGTLDFVSAGRPVPNPAELLGSAAARDLLSKLADRYDEVILDTPPLSVVTDAAVLATEADGLLVVARMGSTHGEELRRAVEELAGIGARVVGTVLTDVHHAEDRYGYRYGHKYHYSSDEDARGSVVLPVLGEMTVSGHTAEQLTDTLREAYRKYLNNPSIEVTVLRRVAVQGEVMKPGLYPADATISIAELITLAGGVTPNGNQKKIELLRNGRVLVSGLGPGAVLQRSPVQSGDAIFVPQKGWFSRNGQIFLYGAVSLATAVLARLIVR